MPKSSSQDDRVAKNWLLLEFLKLPSIWMKSPVHPVSIFDVPVAWGASVSKEKAPDASQIRY